LPKQQHSPVQQAGTMRKKNDNNLHDAMQDMLKEFKLKPHLDETRVKMLWEKLMGKTISTYTSNVAVRKNVLYLTILSAPLKHELSYSKDKIISLINDEMGEAYIKEVVIR
jgi:hypothetical protein